jgi:hypothetical protein
MQRREFMASLFSGVAARAPLPAQRKTGEWTHGAEELSQACASLAIHCRQLQSNLQATNEKLWEAREDLSWAHGLVYQMYIHVGSLLMAANRVRNNTSCQLSDQVRDELDFIEMDGKRFFGLVGMVYEGAKRERASANVGPKQIPWDNC